MFNKTVKKLNITVFIIACFFSGAIFAQLQPVLQVNDERTDRASTSQTAIDGFQDNTDKLSAEYKIVSKQIEGLKVYNAQKRKQIKRQIERMEEIETSDVACLIYTSGTTGRPKGVFRKENPPPSKTEQLSTM